MDATNPTPLPVGDDHASVTVPDALDANPPAVGTPPFSSATPSFMDEIRSATPLPVPNPPFLSDNRNSLVSTADSLPAESVRSGILRPSDSRSPLEPSKVEPSYTQDKQEPQHNGAEFERSVKRDGRTRRILLAAFAGIVLIIVAVVLGVYFGVVRKNNNHTDKPSGASAGGHSSSSGPKPTGTAGNPSSAIVYGGDGTVVTTEQGTTFTYSNKFGGYFVQDSTNPFNNGARPQSWSPALNETWQWGKDQVLGVNLGGWLVLEPFITPSLYQKYPTAIDEWTLSTAMAADTAGGGLGQLEDHYKSFITEEDFAQIAGAGLNWVRLPIPYWAIDTWDGEPFLPKVCWKYALKAFDWARKYGIRVLLDLHAVPGSQNGYNHSGQFGKVNFMNGVMGIANAQRTLHYIRIFTEFISQPQYRDVVQMFGIVNEPTGLDFTALSNFYVEAHRLIRSISGVGAGNGPIISIQGGNNALTAFTGSDRIALEQHPYFAFDGAGATDVVPYITKPCEQWGTMMNTSQQSFGITTAAEWSLGFNDCGFMLHTTADEHTTANCPTTWDAWENYTPTQKQNLMKFTMANMDALQHWFFWTWKIGPKLNDPNPRSPLWSYKLGLDNGWIPKNPRDSFGTCASLGIAQNQPFNGNYLPWQTGGAGDTGVIDAADQAKFGVWPPASMSGTNVALLPTYTATGPVPTLPTQTYPSPTPTTGGGDGWFDDADNAPGIIPVAGCPYPPAWDATGAVVPAAVCTGAASAHRKREPAPLPIITPA